MQIFYNKILNRPVSSNLLIYKPQLTSLTSIWHRISGFLLIFSVLFFVLYLKCISNYFFVCFYLTWNFKFQFFLYYFFYLTIFYHFVNGLKFIIFNFTYLIKLNSLNVFFGFFVIISFLILLTKFLNFNAF